MPAFDDYCVLYVDDNRSFNQFVSDVQAFLDADRIVSAISSHSLNVTVERGDRTTLSDRLAGWGAGPKPDFNYYSYVIDISSRTNECQVYLEEIARLLQYLRRSGAIDVVVVSDFETLR